MAELTAIFMVRRNEPRPSSCRQTFMATIMELVSTRLISLILMLIFLEANF